MDEWRDYQSVSHRFRGRDSKGLKGRRFEKSMEESNRRESGKRGESRKKSRKEERTERKKNKEERRKHPRNNNISRTTSHSDHENFIGVEIASGRFRNRI